MLKLAAAAVLLLALAPGGAYAVRPGTSPIFPGAQPASGSRRPQPPPSALKAWYNKRLRANPLESRSDSGGAGAAIQGLNFERTQQYGTVQASRCTADFMATQLSVATRQPIEGLRPLAKQIAERVSAAAAIPRPQLQNTTSATNDSLAIAIVKLHFDVVDGEERSAAFEVFALPLKAPAWDPSAESAHAEAAAEAASGRTDSSSEEAQIEFLIVVEASVLKLASQRGGRPLTFEAPEALPSAPRDAFEI